MFAVYLTHPQVAIEPDRPVPDWRLSETGRRRIEAFRAAAWIRDLCRIVSSGERKAVETATMIAAISCLSVEIIDDMGENDRSATGFLPPPDFEVAADRFFAEPKISFRGWERAIDAQSRIVASVDRVLADHDPACPIMFVGHGGVGTLLKCHVAFRPIARSQDQGPGGGGMLFAIGLPERRLLCDWTQMESSLAPSWAG
jgi:broad specificity phosphatase PhoE